MASIKQPTIIYICQVVISDIDNIYAKQSTMIILYQVVYDSIYQVVYNDICQVVYNDIYQVVYDDIYEVVYDGIYQAVYNDIYQVVYNDICQVVYNDICQIVYNDICQVVYNVSFLTTSHNVQILIKYTPTTGAALKAREVGRWRIGWIWVDTHKQVRHDDNAVSLCVIIAIHSWIL